MDSKNTRWIVSETPDMEEVFPANVPAILCKLMAQRGVSAGEMERFLRPKLKDISMPSELPEVEMAVSRIFEAIDAGQGICIYGDYDVDGITSVALLYQVLIAYGAKAEYFIPKRGLEGYGLNALALERLHIEHPGIELLITVDCGTASVDEVVQLGEKDIDVIIVDHHELSPEGRPDCVAMVNPKLGEDFHYLCAAGVVFKLAHALMIERRNETIDLKDFIELVAIATIADIVPLVDENRLLVRHGLQRLLKTNNVGLAALINIVNLKDRITSMDVGFRIGPRINAAGRMDQPEEALLLLLENDDKKAATRAQTLDAFNIDRQNRRRRYG